MAKRKPDVINSIEIGKPFKSYCNDVKTIGLEINLRDIADPYVYHDFPKSETIYFTEEELDKLIEILTKRKLEMQELK